MNPQTDSVQCISPAGLHRMAYRQWGNPENPRVLVCVHGLTRSARDFDRLAQNLCDHYRVVCPDVVGRGDSDWLRDPKYYEVPQYVADMVTLLARLHAETVHWFGTSMGGLIGMGLAALPDSPIKKLVLNDVGPVLNGVALKRIGDFVGTQMTFESYEQAEQTIRTVSAPFGPHSDAEWRALTDSVVRQKNGQWTLHYDPAIGINARAQAASVPDTLEFWWGYDPITCPVLAVRGEHSDLLSRATHQQMGQRGPKAQLVEIPGVGHAPTFMHDDQIEIVRRFLLG
ncbi:MAG: alpha/beta hydrolase [Burkholderiaceae bacterium]|nr:MAG: alpha/beta hydrolase [Burkholderiaceae bacterium]